MKVAVNFNASVASGSPKVGLGSRHDQNNATVIECREGSNRIEAELNLAEIDEIQFSFMDKEPSPDPSKDTFVEITDLIVDGISMQHFILNGRQWPRYDGTMRIDHNLPEYFQPGTTMYLNGIWTMPIQLPVWKHLLENYYA